MKRFVLPLLLALVAAATAITMYRVALSHTPRTEEAASHRVKEAAVALSSAIDRDFSQRYIGVQQLTRDVAARNKWNWNKPDDSGPLVAAINRYVSRSGDDLSMLVSPDGAVLAVNNENSNGDAIDTTSLYEQNFAEALWFTDARDGKFLAGANGFTGTAVTGPYNDKALGALMGNDGLALAFSTPMVDDAGTLIGVWVNFLSFSHVERLMADTYRTLSADGLARTNLTLVDSKGVVLVDFDPSAQGGEYKRNYSVIGKLNMLDAGVESVAAAINGKQEGSARTMLAGRTLLVDGYSYSRGWQNYPGLGWTVLVRASSDELFAHRATEKKLREAGLVLTVGALLLGLIGSFWKRAPRAVAEVPTLTEAPATPVKKPEKKTSKRTAFPETVIPEIQASVAELVSAATDVRREMERLLPLAQETKRRSGLINGSLSHAAMATSQIDGAISELTSATEAMEKQLARPQNPVPLSTLTEAMQLLMATSDKLQEISPFITNLANQVNLLALNATIEAARAGESGESLTSMAAELKALAAEASSATEGISTQLSTSRGVGIETLDSLRTAMKAMESSTGATDSVASALDQQRGVTSKIVRNVGNASSNLREAGDIVGTVEQGADETAASVKQLQATAATLQRHIAALNEKLESWTAQQQAA